MVVWNSVGRVDSWPGIKSDTMPSDADWNSICEINSTIQRETLALVHIAFVIAYHQLSVLSGN